MLIERRSFLSSLGLVCVTVGCSSSDPAPNEPGAKQPGFQLQDFQPQSTRFGETYGLEEFRGSVLVLPLYAGWCNTCLGCANILNDVYKQWQDEGLNVRVAAINPINASHNQKALTLVCDFPLLQDTEQQGAWDALFGIKDDTYVYSPEGVLGTFVRPEADLRRMIVSEAGKALVRKAIVDAGG
jgi:peroxiredoxin